MIGGLATIRGIAIDGGLASCGVVVVETDGYSNRCVDADVFRAPRDTDLSITEDRVERGANLAAWLEGFATRHRLFWLAAERMSFPPGINAVAAIALGWGVLSSFIGRHELPYVSAGPMQWRQFLVGKSGNEDAAHRAAIRAIPSFADAAAHVPRDMQEHVLDAAGVYTWSLSTFVVKGLLA